MNLTSVLVKTEKVARSVQGVQKLRFALHKRAMDAAANSPRIWMEDLEPRRMLTVGLATAAIDQHYGINGYAAISPPLAGVDWTEVDALANGPGSSTYALINVDVSVNTDPDYGTHLALMQLNADGTPNLSFGQGGIVVLGGFWLGVNGGSFQVLPDGKLLIAGSGYYANQVIVTRLNPDGSFDSTFGVDGQFVDPGFEFNSWSMQSWVGGDGKITVVGTGDGIYQPYGFQSNNIVTMRLNADGTLDTSYGNSGFQYSQEVPLLSGTPPPGIKDFVAISTIAASPSPNGGATVYLDAQYFADAAVEAEGYQTDPIDLVQVQLDSNGSVVSSKVDYSDLDDPEFGWALTHQADGSSLLLEDSAGIARLNTDGTPDASFDAAPSVDGFIPNGFTVQPDGKVVLVGGDATSNGLWRLNGNGSTDPTFAGGEPALGLPWTSGSALSLADGSFLVSVYPNGDASQAALVKILPSGGIPDSFDELSLDSSVSAGTVDGSDLLPDALSGSHGIILSTDGNLSLFTVADGNLFAADDSQNTLREIAPTT
jgi:uncharacterized delta-60 repeat protein